MIERIPEPELMNGAEQAAAYANADFAAVNQSFVDAFVAQVGDLGRARIADLGCGPADIAIRLCRALAEIEVVAVDGAPAMLDRARAALAAAGLSTRITLVEGCIPGALPGRRDFDAIISNSLLHHLPDPAALWSELTQLGRPGSQVLIVDLMRPESRRRARAIVDEYSGGEPAVLREDFENSLLAAFTVDEVKRQLGAHGLGDRLRVATLTDRHLAISGRL